MNTSTIATALWILIIAVQIFIVILMIRSARSVNKTISRIEQLSNSITDDSASTGKAKHG